jgi:hypothetical protein
MTAKNHVKWPSIESFHNIRKAVKNYPHIVNGNHKVTYRGKVKLHGTNAAIQFLEDDVVAQSRTTILEVGHDNAGFATWVNEHVRPAELRSLKGLTVFGEWCGPGVQKGCAVHMIDQKSFAVFAIIQRVSEDVPVEDQENDFIAHPNVIEALIAPLLKATPNVYVLPWHTEEVVIDWNLSADDITPIVDSLNKAVEEVEVCDPWVKATFGKEGIGEGIVYYPLSVEHIGRDMFSTLAFKAKGEKHKVVKNKAPVVIDAATAASMAEFVDMVVTEPRLEQGAQEACEGQYEMKKIGPFIGWMNSDIHKECQAELEASGLTWKQVHKAITAKVRIWYINKVETT